MKVILKILIAVTIFCGVGTFYFTLDQPFGEIIHFEYLSEESRAMNKLVFIGGISFLIIVATLVFSKREEKDSEEA